MVEPGCIATVTRISLRRELCIERESTLASERSIILQTETVIVQGSEVHKIFDESNRNNR